jgi:hypothetical protein
VPPPADADAVILGGVSDKVYGPESPLNVKVRESGVMVNLIDSDVAEE